MEDILPPGVLLVFICNKNALTAAQCAQAFSPFRISLSVYTIG